MNKLFEVPYNFSRKLLSFYVRNLDKISCLFVPPFKNDSINTRSSIETHRKGSCYMPKTRDEYELHLRYIVQNGLKFVVLWQDPNLVISNEIVKYYKELGASGFIVGNDINAKTIKEIDTNLIVICSLVQRVCSHVKNRDFTYYDKVLLYYPYNRGINALKQLSFIKEKIVLMPNTFCHVDCPSMHHWFPNSKKHFSQKRDCPAIKDVTMSGFISPEDLYLFDDYIGGYKIQGREYTTDLVIYICSIYFKRTSSVELLNTMMGEDLTEKMLHYKQAMQLEDYYNIKSDEIIGNCYPY